MKKSMLICGMRGKMRRAMPGGPVAIVASGGVRVMSYNVFCRPKPIVTNRKDWRKDRLALLARRAPAYDILCLQEFFQTRRNRKATKAFLRDLSLAGFAHAVPGPKPTAATLCGGCQVVDSGLLIASRHPILAHDSILFRAGGSHSDAYCCKGAVYARVFVDGTGREGLPPTIVHIFTTHLQASYFSKVSMRRDSSGKPIVDPVHGLECFRRQTADGEPQLVAEGTAHIRTRQLEELGEFITRCLALETRVPAGISVGRGSSVVGCDGETGPQRLCEYCLLMGDMNVDKFEQPLDFEGCFLENSTRVANCYDIDAGVYLGPDAHIIAQAYDSFYGKAGRVLVQPPAMGRIRSSLEYELMMQTLRKTVKWGSAPARVVDTLEATLGGLVPATFGDSIVCNGCLTSRDRQITAEDDRCSNMSLDHCIQFFREDGVEGQSPERSTSCVVDTCVLRRGEHHILPLLSDHCALDAVVGHPALRGSRSLGLGTNAVERGSLQRGGSEAHPRLLGPVGVPSQRPAGTSPVPDTDPESLAEMLSEIVETSDVRAQDHTAPAPEAALVPASEDSAGAPSAGPQKRAHTRTPSKFSAGGETNRSVSASASAGPSRLSSKRSSKRSSKQLAGDGAQGEGEAREKRGGCETGV